MTARDRKEVAAALRFYRASAPPKRETPASTEIEGAREASGPRTIAHRRRGCIECGVLFEPIAAWHRRCPRCWHWSLACEAIGAAHRALSDEAGA